MKLLLNCYKEGLYYAVNLCYFWMMQPQLLLAELKSTLSKQKVEELARLIGKSGFSVAELIDLTFHADEQVSFRASWILESIYIHHTLQFWPHAIYFLTRFHEQDNLSSRRHFAKILALMTNGKAPRYIKECIHAYNTDELVELVFGWLIDEHVPVAVKSHCLNILANLSSKHEWITNELKETMEFLVDKESIAFFAKVKQIRKQLNRKSNF